MPKYRFRWDHFDDQTVRDLALASGFDAKGSRSPREYLADQAKRPNERFVKDAWRAVLSSPWLRDYRGLDQVVDELIELQIGPSSFSARSATGYLEFLQGCRNCKTLRRVVARHMIAFGESSSADEAVEVAGQWMRSFAPLDPSKSQPDGRAPHPYQREAWNRLNERLGASESTGQFRGLLVMPTGSGKTFTAVRWVLENVINRRQRVLWVAHRYELLEQAAREFDRAAFLVAPPDRRLRRRIVSGKHAPTSTINPEDDVLLCSIASLARRPDIVEQVLSDHFIVIDEAHHAPAKSYRDLVGRMTRGGAIRVLGLTATPTRTVESERSDLTRLFGAKPVYEAKVRELIDQGYLANPIPVRVRTDADAEAGLTGADLDHWTRFRELSEEWQDRVAHIELRNRKIVEEYVRSRDKYKKTLIFAINVAHAHLLSDAFRARGIEAGCIASYDPSGDGNGDLGVNNREVLERFRDPGSGLDVLVNVLILTEGVDVPNIQTVFLTRPTQSEILLRQMVGRAMRGPKAGGTEDAYLVSFEDHWERFRELESPFDRLPDIVEPEKVDPAVRQQIPKELLAVEDLPFEIIRAAASEIRRVGQSQPADVFEAVPHGWYLLERSGTEEDGGDEATRERIHAYEHQKPCWDALIDHLESLEDDDLRSASVERLVAEFFGDCDPPQASDHDVGRLLAHYRDGGSRPQYHAYAERARSDPRELAKIVIDGRADLYRLAEEHHQSNLVKSIYPAFRDYVKAIEEAVFDLRYPSQASERMKPGLVVFEPRADQRLRPPEGKPAHDLAALLNSVLADGNGIVGAALAFTGQVTWTNRLIKGWFGKADWTRNLIRMNVLLNSKDVAEATVRFLLWHEFLHVYLRAGHTPRFRELEAKWPGKIEADRDLDGLPERFGLVYGVPYWGR